MDKDRGVPRGGVLEAQVDPSNRFDVNRARRHGMRVRAKPVLASIVTSISGAAKAADGGAPRTRTLTHDGSAANAARGSRRVRKSVFGRPHDKRVAPAATDPSGAQASTARRQPRGP